jgi:hypothetical protein
MGEFRDIRWTWKSRDNDTRVGYLAVDGRVSLGELVDHLMQVAPHVSVFGLQLNWATVVWERDATPEEIAERRAVQARHDARHEQWERETYARLRAKFEPPTPAGQSRHACSQCGSTQWVGYRAGPDPDLPRYAQCVPCGKIGDRIGPDEVR